MICIILFLVFISVMALAQRTGDFRTHSPVSGGKWSSTSTWDRFNGTSWITPAPNAPNGGAFAVTVQSGDSVDVDVPVTISDSLVSLGKIAGGSDTNLTMGNGGVYRHASTNAIVKAIWGTGSLFYMNAVVNVTSIGGGSQNFYNIIWNCPSQISNTSIGMSGDTIRGNITVLNTGNGRLYLTTSSTFAEPIVILGDINVVKGTFSSNGSGSAGTVDPIVVKSYGNITVAGDSSTKTNFGCSRGSGPMVEWYVYGNMSVTRATLQNSGSSSVQKFIFAKSGTQTLTLADTVNYGSGSSAINIDVDSGATLDIGSSVISNKNTGSFNLKNGAFLKSSGGSIASTADYGGGNTFAIAGNIQGSGSVTAKATTPAHPNLSDATKALKRYWTITAEAGVTQADLQFNYLASEAQGTQANYVAMHYTGAGTSWSGKGTVDATTRTVTAPAITAVAGVWTLGESSLTGVKSQDAAIPSHFFVDQNYPNPFNPSTIISYGIPKNGFVTAKVYNLLGQEIALLFAGYQNAGIHTLAFDASNLSSGVYLYRIQAGNVVETKRMVVMK
jgi:hypothetical protein